MFDFSENDDQRPPLSDWRRVRRGESPLMTRTTPDPMFAGMESEQEIAGPGPQRAATELPAIDAPPVGSNQQSAGGSQSSREKPALSMAAPDVTSATSARRATGATRPSMAGPALDPLELDRQQHQAELSRLHSTGSGISQIHNRFLRGLARVGDIAGTAFFPSIAEAVPGTELHHRRLMSDETNAIEQDLGEEQKQAQTEAEKAQSRHLGEEDKKIEHDLNTPDSPTDKAIHSYVDKDGNQATVFQRPDNSTYVKTFGQVQQKPEKPDTGTQLKEKFMATLKKAVPGGNVDPAVMTDVRKLTNVIVHSATLSPQEKEDAISYLIANPTPAAAGANVQIVQSGANQRQASTQNFDFAKDVRKQYDLARDADERLDRMKGSYQKALHGDQQAMLALLTDHIGMTLGLQKGARITRDILNEATESQPGLQKLAAKFDDRGFLSGVTLGPAQMQQMLDLGYEARNRKWGRAFSDSQMYGIEEPPGARNIYRGDRSFKGDQEAAAAGGGVGKTITQEKLQQAARDHNISYDQAKKAAESQGYKVVK